VPTGWLLTGKASRSAQRRAQQSVADLERENAHLRKQLAQVQMEREILKKATAYFAKESLQDTRS